MTRKKLYLGQGQKQDNKEANMEEKNNESLFPEEFLNQIEELKRKIDPEGKVLKTTANNIKELDECKKKLELEKLNNKVKINDQR